MSAAATATPIVINDASEIVALPHPRFCEVSASVAALSEGRPLTRQEMLRQFISIAIPATTSQLLSVAAQTVTLMFVGRELGPIALAQIAVGLTVYNVFGYSLGVGFANALDTLVSQAYGRDPANPEIGEYMQRGILVNYSVGIPVSLFFLFGDSLMIVIFGPQLGSGAAEFLRFSVPYLFVMYTVNCVYRTIEGQNLPHLVTIANCATAVCCPLFNLMLTHRGIWGAATALTCTMFVNLVILIAFCIFHPKVVVRKTPFPAPTLWSLVGIKRYLQLAVPSLISVCSEWWAFEALTVIAAYISPHEVTCLAIAISLITVLFATALGLSTGCSVCIGNSLGANRPVTAQAFFKLGFFSSGVFGVIVALTTWAFGHYWVAAYTSDPDVIKTLDSILPVIATLHICNNTQFVLQGTYRGCGMQKVSARVAVLALWFVGLPCAVLMSVIFQFGVGGILGGLICGFLVGIPLLTHLMSKWNWAELALRAIQPVGVPSATLSGEQLGLMERNTHEHRSESYLS